MYRDYHEENVPGGWYHLAPHLSHGTFPHPVQSNYPQCVHRRIEREEAIKWKERAPEFDRPKFLQVHPEIYPASFKPS